MPLWLRWICPTRNTGAVRRFARGHQRGRDHPYASPTKGACRREPSVPESGHRNAAHLLYPIRFSKRRSHLVSIISTPLRAKQHMSTSIFGRHPQMNWGRTLTRKLLTEGPSAIKETPASSRQGILA
jgi:hypothetical protein